jgi:ribokinase
VTPTFFLGDVSLDRYFEAERWPGLADRAAMRPLPAHVGGMVANAARVFAGFGAPAEFVTILNRGELCAGLVSALEAAGLGTRFIAFDDAEPDPQTLVFLVEGDDVILWSEASQLPIPLSAAGLESLASRGFLYSTLSRLARLRGPAGEPVLPALRAAGRALVIDLDVDGIDERAAQQVAGAHTLLVNEHGFDRSEIGDVPDWLDAHGFAELIVTLGAQGARLYTRETTIEAPGLSVDVVDVTGAGDTFGGAYTYALTQSWPAQRRLRFATAAAARAVTHLGPAGGVATVAEVASFAADNEAS